MEHREGTLDYHGTCIYHRSWLPEGNPRAAIVLFHGLAEHSGRYGALVEQWTAAGYAVYALDLIGHGRSQGQRAYVQRFSEYSALMHDYVAQVRARLPDKPLFCFGHSMGAVVLVCMVLDYTPALSGIILSGTSTEMPDDVTPLLVKVGKFLSALVPRLPLKALESETLSHDPAVVQGYDQDPLVYRRGIPARTGIELMAAQQRIVAHAGEIAVPTLMVHGGDDRLCPLPGAQRFYEALGAEDKRFQVYEGSYHEVCNEPECSLVMGNIADWIEAHL